MTNATTKLEYWSCPNGHIVPRQHMPRSGTTCNVVGCEQTRTKHHLDTSDDVLLIADRLISAVYDQDDTSLAYVYLSAEAERLVIEQIESQRRNQ